MVYGLYGCLLLQIYLYTVGGYEGCKLITEGGGPADMVII
jgi:hypothetical protein